MSTGLAESTLAVPSSADISVGLGRLEASGAPGQVLTALGLGSCIGLMMIDPAARVGGLAHVMLPAVRGDASLPGKFADTAPPALLAAVEALGARRHRLIIKIAGGAQMFSSGSGARTLNVGERNEAAVREALAKLGLSVAAADTGGTRGRTVRLDVTTGRTTVRLAGGQARDL